jgi:hypothetical protein
MSHTTGPITVLIALNTQADSPARVLRVRRERPALGMLEGTVEHARLIPRLRRVPGVLAVAIERVIGLPRDER